MRRQYVCTAVGVNQVPGHLMLDAGYVILDAAYVIVDGSTQHRAKRMAHSAAERRQKTDGR
jgi:ribonuclease PH